MQIDLHHTGTYVLCRLAGMKSCYAEIVAYAAQQVDDAIYGHALKFNNGGAFHQVQTAHSAASGENLDINNALEVWMPFHFLPSEIDINNEESQITKPNSNVLKSLLKNIKDTSKSPIALYRLGIALHCFEDTYSHQDFIGYYNSYNNVKLESGITYKYNSIKYHVNRFLTFLGSHSEILSVGHGEVLSNPDIPYVDWSYSRNNNEIMVNNLEERYIPALNDIYNFLIEYVKRNSYLKNDITAKPFEFYKEKFHNLLEYEGDAEIRHKNWLENIKDNYFEFEDFCSTDQELYYEPREWFEEAVDAQKIPWYHFIDKSHERISNYHTFTAKENFQNSNWVKFMHAAAEHRFVILHKILAENLCENQTLISCFSKDNVRKKE